MGRMRWLALCVAIVFLGIHESIGQSDLHKTATFDLAFTPGPTPTETLQEKATGDDVPRPDLFGDVETVIDEPASGIPAVDDRGRISTPTPSTPHLRGPVSQQQPNQTEPAEPTANVASPGEEITTPPKELEQEQVEQDGGSAFEEYVPREPKDAEDSSEPIANVAPPGEETATPPKGLEQEPVEQDGGSAFEEYVPREPKDVEDSSKKPPESATLLVDDAEELRHMTDRALEGIFRNGTISLGLPEGYYLGYSMLRGRMRYVQRPADLLWAGKWFETLEGTNCNGSCGQTGRVFNLQGPELRRVGPGTTHLGRMRDFSRRCRAQEADSKLSVVVDYGDRGVGDELRVINSEQKILLGRGCAAGVFLGYFVVTHYPTRSDVALRTPRPTPSPSTLTDDDA